MNTAFITKPLAKAGRATGHWMLDWRNWVYGLVSGSISGVSGGGVTWLGMLVAHNAGAGVHVLNWHELGIVCMSQGAFGAFLYLKQSPLPPKIIHKTHVDRHHKKH